MLTQRLDQQRKPSATCNLCVSSRRRCNPAPFPSQPFVTPARGIKWSRSHWKGLFRFSRTPASSLRRDHCQHGCRMTRTAVLFVDKFRYEGLSALEKRFYDFEKELQDRFDKRLAVMGKRNHWAFEEMRRAAEGAQAGIGGRSSGRGRRATSHHIRPARGGTKSKPRGAARGKRWPKRPSAWSKRCRKWHRKISKSPSVAAQIDVHEAQQTAQQERRNVHKLRKAPNLNKSLLWRVA
ncbi:hypothetical protein PCASD_20023 [Puccinia coronata f. sp. avenae]|uniref:Uncharacterized protein n=1 Tax=Puccinia coronata f. sp. avenae TaxID=200324 RepID=A0A2N5TAK4_9BASI|nr:hypothetical protein PCASD_20023 [Puccinia coronata f. sp. avenae]